MSVNREDISSEDPELLFRVLEMIGQGSFGIVCTCVNTSDNKIYAVKFIEINEDDGGDIQNEIDILKATTNCPNVVKYYGSYLKENYLMIVMEYCGGGSVLDVIQVCNRGMTEQQISSICLHSLRGLNYMHKNKILHRDIKAGNILLSNTGAAKLADFGVSTRLLTTIQKHKTVVGSPYWMSPEVIVAPNGANGYDHKADIWSLGIAAIEMAEMKPPHYDINPLRVIFVIPNRTPPTLKEPSKWSPEFNDFVAQCLHKNAADRPSAEELLNHPFVTQAISTSESVIAALVETSQPLLEELRKSSKDREEDVGGTVKAGTVIQVNTINRTAVFADEDDEDDEDPYLTVKYDPARGGSYSSDSGSVIYKD